MTAYCTRFVTAFLIKVGRLPKSASQHETLVLTPDKIQQASSYWVRRIQKEEFEPELLDLNRDDKIKLNSSLKTLHPILDEFGIILLGGRLHNAPINYNEKHPIILPRHQIILVPRICGPLKNSALALSYFRPSPQASRRATKFTVADLCGR